MKRFGIARWIAVGALAGCLFVSTGCLNGLVYTHVTVPLDVNLERTPVYGGAKSDSWNTLRIPLPGFLFVQADWGSSAIADAARTRGLQHVYYADLEILRVLGVWTQRWAVVYGE